jgi:ABC-type oligopeptide transport system ATPase subunit
MKKVSPFEKGINMKIIKHILRKQIDEVFTPRNAFVNETMYIQRPDLENALKRKIRGTQNIIVYGESGCGKSWLYKKVLSELDIPYCAINLANASIQGGIIKQIENELLEETPRKIGYTEKKHAEVNAGVARGGLDHNNNYVIGQKEPITRLFHKMHVKAKGEKSFVIFENLESIFSDRKLMNELGSLIILLDDENYAQYRVRFIIVGVPSSVIEYYSKTKNLETVSNRLVSIPEVSRLSREQVRDFIEKGFVQELKIDLFKLKLFDVYFNHIEWVTNGIPQKLHEYCEELSYLCEENNWVPEKQFLGKTDKSWLLNTLHKSYEVIDNLMNSPGTKIGRRNQVLYCLGKLNSNIFTVIELERLLRDEFPNTTKERNLNLTVTLNDIVDCHNFIRRSNSNYIITDMQYILCIRAMLKKTEDEKVVKVSLDKIK